jgi:hypothetical protein
MGLLHWSILSMLVLSRGIRTFMDRAYIRVNNKTINLGHYGSAEFAAKVYDVAAKKHFGKFQGVELSLEENSYSLHTYSNPRSI